MKKFTLFAGLAFLTITLCAVGIMAGPSEAATPLFDHLMDRDGYTLGAASLVGFSGIIINQANMATVFTGFRTIFNDAFDNAPVDWNKIAMEVASNTRTESYGWLGSTTRFREWVGDRVLQGLQTHDYSIKNLPFENTIIVDRDDLQDDTHGVYSPMIANMGHDARSHPDELVFSQLQAGVSALCYDGQYFFDTDHPVLDVNGVEQSVSNTAGGAETDWYLLDMSRPIKPIIFQKRKAYDFQSMDAPTDENVFMRKQFIYGVDARANTGFGLWQMAYHSKLDLTAANFGAAYSAMREMKGDHGRPLNIKPTVLVVPPSLRDKAHAVLKAERDANGATNIYRDMTTILDTAWLA